MNLYYDNSPQVSYLEKLVRDVDLLTILHGQTDPIAFNSFPEWSHEAFYWLNGILDNETCHDTLRHIQTKMLPIITNLMKNYKSDIEDMITGPMNDDDEEITHADATTIIFEKNNKKIYLDIYYKVTKKLNESKSTCSISGGKRKSSRTRKTRRTNRMRKTRRAKHTRK